MRAAGTHTVIFSKHRSTWLRELMTQRVTFWQSYLWSYPSCSDTKHLETCANFRHPPWCPCLLCKRGRGAAEKV